MIKVLEPEPILAIIDCDVCHRKQHGGMLRKVRMDDHIWTYLFCSVRCDCIRLSEMLNNQKHLANVETQMVPAVPAPLQAGTEPHKPLTATKLQRVAQRAVIEDMRKA